MLRQAQRERKIFNDFSTRPVRPAPVEGRMRVFFPHLKKDSYICELGPARQRKMRRRVVRALFHSSQPTAL